MTSHMMRDYLVNLQLSLDHEFIPAATPNKNAFIESFFSIVEIEFMQTRYFRTYGDAYAQAVDFIKKYNECRIHGSLGFVTPLQAEKDFALNGNTTKVVRV